MLAMNGAFLPEGATFRAQQAPYPLSLRGGSDATASSMGIMKGDDKSSGDSRFPARSVDLPPVIAPLQHSTSRGETLQTEGTNVIRVPFGVRRSRRVRPERPDRWATLVLPFQASGPTPPPPQAA
jgi:hypothetical protein